MHKKEKEYYENNEIHFQFCWEVHSVNSFNVCNNKCAYFIMSLILIDAMVHINIFLGFSLKVQGFSNNPYHWTCLSCLQNVYQFWTKNKNNVCLLKLLHRKTKRTFNIELLGLLDPFVILTFLRYNKREF